MMWSTADGSDRGCITSDCELICCDISHDTHEIVVTLEIDGEIRVFKRASEYEAIAEGAQFPESWELVRSVSLDAPIVEVKIERSLLLAVTHSEDGERGAIHVWKLPMERLDCLENPRSLQCPRPPDRVEARHGGRFIEAFFVPATDCPNGIYDIEWFDPTMNRLLQLRGIGDWRCDLRDAVARLEGSEGSNVSWLPLWTPVFRSSKGARCAASDSAS
eukprot:Skav226553  [mRNA]  locus=scaffold421:281242:281895:- [translate_table: standard]